MDVTGTCHALLVFEVGFSVSLDRAQSRLAKEDQDRRRFLNERRAPAGDVQLPRPLRLTQLGESVEIGPWRTGDQVEIVLFEFGAVGVTYSIPVEAPIERLVGLSDALYDNAALIRDARARVEVLCGVLGDAIDRPLLSPEVEDYVIFSLLPPAVDLESWVEAHRDTLARVLRAERGPLSSEEVDDALFLRTAYRPTDLCLIDWFAAVLFGEDTRDERAALEIAVVELLELRLLDGALDHRLEAAYQLAARKRTWYQIRSPGTDLWRIAQMEADSALLFEGVDNAAKLLGDQYLARVYRVASARFHLSEWDAAIERKLHMLGSMHEKLVGRADIWRSEALTWIIIMLFLFEVLRSFM